MVGLVENQNLEIMKEFCSFHLMGADRKDVKKLVPILSPLAHSIEGLVE